VNQEVLMKTHLLSAALLSFIAAPTFLAADEIHKVTAAGLRGCLNGPTDDGTFVLTRVHAHDVQVGGIDDLKDHVGQRVRLHGLWVSSGAQIGEKENAAAKIGDTIGTRKHFRVTKIEKISDSCSPIQ
jgi:hypothetical protein